MEKELIALYRQIDQAFNKVAVKFPHEFKCKIGCCDCCHAAFDISLIEAVTIKKAFNILGKKTKKYCIKRAKEASELWEQAIEKKADLSRVRIPCPLLNRDNECILYKLRPVNCRSYGVPTEIHGKGHVCHLSGFVGGKSYPTIRLHIIQQLLLELSMNISKKNYYKRITIADAILKDLP